MRMLWADNPLQKALSSSSPEALSITRNRNNMALMTSSFIKVQSKRVTQSTEQIGINYRSSKLSADAIRSKIFQVHVDA